MMLFPKPPNSRFCQVGQIVILTMVSCRSLLIFELSFGDRLGFVGNCSCATVGLQLGGG